MIRNERGFGFTTASWLVMETAVLKSGGRLYRIPKAPFETMAQVCERGHTIIQQTQKETVCDATKKQAWLHASYMTFYEKQGVKYD